MKERGGGKDGRDHRFSVLHGCGKAMVCTVSGAVFPYADLLIRAFRTHLHLNHSSSQEQRKKRREQEVYEESSATYIWCMLSRRDLIPTRLTPLKNAACRTNRSATAHHLWEQGLWVILDP